jgi:hypothetical protein
MKKTMWALLGQMFLLTCGNAFADIVILKDGRQISGSVESAGSRSLLIRVGEDAQVISMDQVASIEFNPLAAPAVPPSPAATSAVATPAAAIAATPPPAPASPAPPAPVLKSAVATPAAAPAQPGITLPIGTEIAARTIDRIDSKKADKYKEYAASLDDPIVVNGVTVAPVNSNAVLRVTEIHNPKLKGKASLSTTLVAVTINGHRVSLETEKVDSQSGSQSKRTAIGAGGGAAVGAGIGAAAGGGVGAAVGAGVGAAAGTLGAALTAKGVQIPPETRFTYKLAQPAIIDAPANSK